MYTFHYWLWKNKLSLLDDNKWVCFSTYRRFWKNNLDTSLHKELKDRKAKDSYTVLIRFIFNLKRLMEKIPGGKNKIGSYAVAALVFLREEAEDDEQLKKLLGEDYDRKKL